MASTAFSPSASTWQSELGAYLDPLADKALIVSIYISLGIAGALPIFLVILVVSRDIMIISAFMLSLAGRQADADPAAVGLQSQYGGADRAGHCWCWPSMPSASMPRW